MGLGTLLTGSTGTVFVGTLSTDCFASGLGSDNQFDNIVITVLVLD
jgi:hypothetical protein